MSSILSKITAKTLGVNVEAAKESATRLFLIYGVARGVTTGQSTFGEYERLDGQFEAVNIATGEVFISGACFLPALIHNLIAGQLTGEVGSEVKFSFEVGAEPSENAIGYIYTVKELSEASGVDNLSELRATAQLALAAPSA